MPKPLSFPLRALLVGGAGVALAASAVVLLDDGTPAATAVRLHSQALSDEVGLTPSHWDRRPALATPSPLPSLSPPAVPAAGQASRPHNRAAYPAPPAPPPPAATPNFSHVFVIVMENHEFSNIIGNGSAPYINSLAQGSGLALAYYAVAHPSLPNYLALTGGSTFGITSDCTSCFVNAPNLADQVEASGRSWKAYMEDMPSPCYLGAGFASYALRHDPFLYYSDIRNNSGRCAAHVVPFTQFGADLSSGSVPSFAWITPNLCHDMHDCAISVGDQWLQGVVPTILGSTTWRNGGALFITWDEGSTNAGCCGGAYGGHVLTLLISPLGHYGYRSSIGETHYSLLRTIEDAWHLGALGGAASAAGMREFF